MHSTALLLMNTQLRRETHSASRIAIVPQRLPVAYLNVIDCLLAALTSATPRRSSYATSAPAWLSVLVVPGEGGAPAVRVQRHWAAEQLRYL